MKRLPFDLRNPLTGELNHALRLHLSKTIQNVQVSSVYPHCRTNDKNIHIDLKHPQVHARIRTAEYMEGAFLITELPSLW